MNTLVHLTLSAMIRMVQLLPLKGVARLGRAGGALAFWIDHRHRTVALNNLKLCFGDSKSETEIHRIARENFRRIGESYACAIKTAVMPLQDLRSRVDLVGVEKLPKDPPETPGRGLIFAIGHFGNFEIYAQSAKFIGLGRFATTYRGLRQPLFNTILQSLRQQSGCLFFERRTEARALREALNTGNLTLGLLADQHAGTRGARLSFLGHECSTTVAPAVLARRYRRRLFTAICYRIGLGRWRVEVGDEIPIENGTKPRSISEIMADVNQALETAVRRDPANWFWVHKRWKPLSRGERTPSIRLP
jgi:Kdo2-lipid IVA lauroyltransferase/acyltransferase